MMREGVRKLRRKSIWLSTMLLLSVSCATALEPAIPLIDNAPSALNYHHIPIDSKSKKAHEPLVDAGAFGIASSSYYARGDGLNAPYFRKFDSALSRVFVREGVARKLAQANKILKPKGVEILLLDGFRPIELQKELWDYFMQQARKSLTNPTEDACVQFAGRFCSDPRPFKKDDWRTWPTHTTGGAVDVTLREIATGKELNMGGTFDDASEVSRTDYYECNAVADATSAAEARRNRRLLYGAMTAVGFANYPYEWWHYDYGTQMWVMNTHKNQQAIYGRAELSLRKQ